MHILLFLKVERVHTDTARISGQFLNLLCFIFYTHFHVGHIVVGLSDHFDVSLFFCAFFATLFG